MEALVKRITDKHLEALKTVELDCCSNPTPSPLFV